MKTIYCFRFFLVAINILFLISCKVSKTKPVETKLDNLRLYASNGNSCFITGKIIAVNAMTRDTGTSSLSSNYPFAADVFVDKIDNCQPGFTSTINEGDTLGVFFVFSLGPTNKVNDSIKHVFPGLKQGDFFNAWLEQRIQPGNNFSYRIYGYEKR